MGHDLPIGLQLNRIHNFLRAELEPFTSAEILKATQVDIDSSPQIQLSLTGDASKVLREKDGRWRWASKYRLRNFNHLLQLIARSADGVSEKDLHDSYKGVKEDIKKLKKRNAVYEIKTGAKILLFPRDQRWEIQISEEVKERYKTVRIPDAIEVHRYLVAEGLKETDDATGIMIAKPVSRKRPSSTKGGKRKRTRKIKLTNTHMANSNIDLSKDFHTGKDSAFG